MRTEPGYLDKSTGRGLLSRTKTEQKWTGSGRRGWLLMTQREIFIYFALKVCNAQLMGAMEEQMAVVPCIPVPSPQDIQKGLFASGAVKPPVLPWAWNAQILLTPFGGQVTGGLSPSDQLVVGNLSYQAVSSTERLMRVSLYLLESLYYYDFLFHTSGGMTQWWWMISDPAHPNDLPTQAFGPFSAGAAIPSSDFLVSSNFSHVGTFDAIGRSCHFFSGRASAKAGTWYSFDSATKNIGRIMNVEATNDFKVAILGADYFVDFANVQQISQPALTEVLKKCPTGTPAAASAMVTLADIVRAMAAPPSGSQISCTLGQIQSLIPGLSSPSGSIKPPAWTNKVESYCYMIGQDTYPYYCQVWYDWVRGKQVTVFVQQDNADAYTQRFDEVLPKGVVGPAIVYSWDGSQWTPACCQAGGSFVPMPVPNFVEAGHGRCRALIKNNPYFGSISIWSVDLGGASDFWYWFNENQQGVIFSLAPAGSLTIIYYQTFMQNPSMDDCIFDDPCGEVPACAGNNMMMLSAKPRFVPLSHIAK